LTEKLKIQEGGVLRLFEGERSNFVEIPVVDGGQRGRTQAPGAKRKRNRRSEWSQSQAL